MKLARPYRRPPLAIATALAARARRTRPAASRRARSPSAEARRPGLPEPPPRRPRARGDDRRRSSPTRRPGAGSRRSGRASVNVEFVSANPTGPLHDRQRPRRVRRRPALPGPRGRRPARHARVLLQRLRAARSDKLGASVAGASGAASRSRRTATTATTSQELAAARAGRRLGGGDGAGRRHRRRSSATGRPAASARGSRRASSGSASTSTSGRARARSTTRAGSSGRSSACASGGHVYEQDGALWFRSTAFGDDKDRVIIRSNGEPTYFAADIGYVTEKFSRGFDHLIYIWGADHHGTVARVRNAAEAMGYDRGRRPDAALLVGPLRPRRRRGLDVASGPASSSRSTSCWPRSASTPRAGSSRHARRRPGSTSTSSWPRSSRPRTPSTTSSTPTPGSRRSCARRPRPGLAPAADGRRLARRRTRGGPRPGRRPLPGGRRGRGPAEETHGITAYATELATQFHAFYRDARVVDAGRAGAIGGATRARRRAPRSRSPNASACCGISAPESM